MTDPTSTPPEEVPVEGAFIAEPSGDLVVVERGETISAEEGVTFRPATRAEVEEHGFEVAEDGSVVAKAGPLQRLGEPSDEPEPVVGPVDVVEPGEAPAPRKTATAKKRRTGTVTDRARRDG